jgi:hypothetical protein
MSLARFADDVKDVVPLAGRREGLEGRELNPIAERHE